MAKRDPKQPKLPDSATPELFGVPCSREWRIRVDKGIQLEQIPLSRSQRKKGTTLRATPTEAGGVMITSDPALHLLTVSRAPTRWQIRLPKDVSVCADKEASTADAQAYLVRTAKPDVHVTALVSPKDAQAGFLASELPDKLEEIARLKAKQIPPCKSGEDIGD